MSMSGYKAAVVAAWSGAGIKNFKIDIRINEEEPPTLDVYPKTLDGKDIDVGWRLLPNVMKIAQYSISPAGNHTIEREMDFATEDDVEEIFTDEFKSLDDVLEHGNPSESANEDAYMDALDAELEEISKNDSGEIEIIDGIDSDRSAQALADEITALRKMHPEKKYHITAIGTDSDGIADKSEVIWSDYPEEVSADEDAGAFPDGFVYIKPDPKYNRAKWGDRGVDFGTFTNKLHKSGNTYTGMAYVQGALREFSTDGKTGYFRDAAHQIPTENVDYAALWKECQRLFRMNKAWQGIYTEEKVDAKSAPYIQSYVITGGTGPESGEEREQETIDVSGDPEQELWNMVLTEIPADYEQHLFVNNDEYDNLIDDDDVTALKNIGLDAFKKKHGIAKVTSMGYYTHPWSGMLSDLMDYRIKGVVETPAPENETAPANEGRVTSYFVVRKDAEEKAVEKMVATLEDAILNNQTVETTANPDGTVSIEIYGRMTPDEVARAIQLPGQLGTSYVDLAINIEG